MGELEERLKAASTGAGEAPKPKGKSPLEIELEKIDDQKAGELRRVHADNVLLDQKLQLKEKQDQLKGGVKGDESKEPKHKFSAIDGEVIPDPDGELTLTEALGVAANQRAQKAPQKSFMEGLDEILEGGLRKRLADMIAGEGGSTKDKLLNELRVTEDIREALGIKKEASLADRLGNESIRTDLARLILEDERERIKIDKEHEVEMAKVKGEGGFGAASPLIEEVTGALRETAQAYNKGMPKTKAKKVLRAICPHCHEEITFKKKPVGEVPCPKCGGIVKAK